MNLTDALARLRERLRVLGPTGTGGFEGLIATALADFTGLVFRLAKSGSQFGRDASSTPGAFAIAMEAKRYSDDVSLETLAGKATIARQNLHDVIDLWVVAATSEVGDDTALKLHEILEGDGITPLILDWPAQPLPPLAVLLTATRARAAAWFADNIGPSEAAEVSKLLEIIATDSSFPTQAAELRGSCTTAHVGLDALRVQSSEWLRKRLQERLLSRESFGQFLTVNDPSQPAIKRKGSLAFLAQAIAAGNRVIAVLGEEGTGKSWLVSQWWAELRAAPIPIFVAGRRSELLNASDPLEGLARLLIDQSGSSIGVKATGWRRRLDRWARHDHGGALRFVLVIDGLNERPTQPSADFVLGHARAVASLGGILIATARTPFWNANVQPRLGSAFKVERVFVAGYTAEELETVLRQVGADAEELSPRLRDFLSNPRVCAVAMHLLPGLHPSELTVERLLLEYWRYRLEERGDLLKHNAEDFRKLLIAHARDWLAKPRRTFDVDEWGSRSGVVARYGPQAAEHDLTEIQEGRFLTVVSAGTGEYTFRPEVLPFALGLLILADAQREYREDPDRVGEHVKLTLEPLQGFDVISEVIAAAVGLACLDDTCPSTIRELFVGMWCEQQNTTSEAAATIGAYLVARPEAFFAVAEAPADGQLARPAEPLSEIFLRMRDQPQLADVLSRRAARWLTQWSRESYGAQLGVDELLSRHREREERINSRLASFSEAEASIFRRLTVETPRQPGINLHRLATLLLAGKSLSQHAEALLGWALTIAVAPDVVGAEEELAWIIRLNRVDAAETIRGITQIVDDLEQSTASPIRSAAAFLLRLLGDDECAGRARRFRERGTGKRWRRVDAFCDTNPYDPAAPACSNLGKAREAIEAISMPEVWVALGKTIADANLETVTPPLARFDLTSIVTFFRRLVLTLPDRRGMPLRQLAWRLPSLSPLLEADELQTIRTAFRDLLADSTRLNAQDFHWIAAELVSAQIPHLTAGQQLDLMCELPADTPLYYLLLRGTEPLSAHELERRLSDAVGAQNDHVLKWTLFFASAPGHELSEVGCRLVVQAKRSADEDVRRLADRLASRHACVRVTSDSTRQGGEGTEPNGGASHRPQTADKGKGETADMEALAGHISGVLDQLGKRSESEPSSFDDVIGRVISPQSPLLRQLIDRYPKEFEQWVQVLLQADDYTHQALNLGYAVASAYAARDANAAASLLRRLNSSAALTVLLEGIPLAEAALFAVPDVPAFNSLREESFLSAFDDAALERLTVGAERYGAGPWLDRFIDRSITSPVPGDIARALTIAGLRDPNDQSKALLATDFEPGFLGDVAETARENYRWDEWARIWITVAGEATDGFAFWSAGILATDLVDIRTAQGLKKHADSVMVRRYGQELSERLVKAAEKRSRDRKATFLGLRAPAKDLVDLLRES